ncbi:MAG: class I SAM-dependent methyltransferase [Pirellulales bacterium]
MSAAPWRSQLERVLEPEVMDSAEDAHDYDAMDHAEVNRRFVGDFLAARQRVALPADAPVLDIGTGTAQIPIELCTREPRARVVAVDLAAHMLRVAAENVARARLADRITLEHIDAKGLPYVDGHFAAVMSNSIVHHVPEPKRVLAEMLRVTRSGGLVFVRDLARPLDENQVRHLVDSYAAGCNAHQRQLFDDSLRAALSVEEIQALVVELGYAAETVAATSDRHWTWSAVQA